jgi:hypothetical protein
MRTPLFSWVPAKFCSHSRSLLCTHRLVRLANVDLEDPRAIPALRASKVKCTACVVQVYVACVSLVCIYVHTQYCLFRRALYSTCSACINLCVFMYLCLHHRQSGSTRLFRHHFDAPEQRFCSKKRVPETPLYPALNFAYHTHCILSHTQIT